MFGIGGERVGHRPHIDGLRAVAVYLVVAFHARSGQVPSGFIGVDVFFVLSGYLVTGLLVRDLHGEGRIRLGRFYARRARRLLPAASLTLVVTAIVYASIGNPLQLDSAVDDIRAAALYVANWHFIARSTDYFADDLSASPVLHFWSLSIEEQFYLAWPLAFGALHAAAARTGRRAHRLVQGALAAAALASALAALALVGSQPDRAYFGTDTRAYQLLAGALLAVSPGVVGALTRRADRSTRWRRAVPAATVAALGAVAVLASPILDTDPIRRGILATVVTLVLIATLEASPIGPVRRVLSWPPVAYLGQISYGTYLWHWLVILVLLRYESLSATSLGVLAAAIATGLASLSHQVLELPIRTSTWLDQRRAPVIAASVALSLVVGLVVAPRAAEQPGQPSRPTGELAAVPAPAVDRSDLHAAFADTFDYDACPSSGGRLCVLAEGSGPTAVVVGDSHAGVWAEMLVDIAEAHDMTLLGGLLSFCPWPEGIRYTMAGPDCFADQGELYDELLPAADPDLVFLAHRAVDDPNDPLVVRDRDRGPVHGAARDEAVAHRATETVRSLLDAGITVVVFEPLPVARTGTDPLECLAEADPLSCRFVATSQPTAEDRLLRELAAHPAVMAVDADRLACPYLPICDPLIGDQIVWRDANHLTLSFARSLAEPIGAFLEAEGVVGG